MNRHTHGQACKHRHKKYTCLVLQSHESTLTQVQSLKNTNKHKQTNADTHTLCVSAFVCLCLFVFFKDCTCVRVVSWGCRTHKNTQARAKKTVRMLTHKKTKTNTDIHTKPNTLTITQKGTKRIRNTTHCSTHQQVQPQSNTNTHDKKHIHKKTYTQTRMSANKSTKTNTRFFNQRHKIMHLGTQKHIKAALVNKTKTSRCPNFFRRPIDMTPLRFALFIFNDDEFKIIAKSMFTKFGQ